MYTEMLVNMIANMITAGFVLYAGGALIVVILVKRMLK